MTPASKSKAPLRYHPQWCTLHLSHASPPCNNQRHHHQHMYHCHILSTLLPVHHLRWCQCLQPPDWHKTTILLVQPLPLRHLRGCQWLKHLDYHEGNIDSDAPPTNILLSHLITTHPPSHMLPTPRYPRDTTFPPTLTTPSSPGITCGRSTVLP